MEKNNRMQNNQFEVIYSDDNPLNKPFHWKESKKEINLNAYMDLSS